MDLYNKAVRAANMGQWDEASAVALVAIAGYLGAISDNLEYYVDLHVEEEDE